MPCCFLCMTTHHPSFDYDAKGQQYARHRQTDPRIAAYVHAALKDSHAVLNIGAGAGSYEPEDKYVVAVEPSATMRAQRLQRGKVPAVIGSAGSLPFDDDAFDASMAIYTIHHWPDAAAGLREMRRVTKGPVLIYTSDPNALDDFWNIHYFPEVVAAEKRRYPTIDFITGTLGGRCEVQAIPVPLDCADGFQEAFYGRPEAFLSPDVRANQSAWGFVDAATVQRSVQHLADDLASGAWDAKYSHYRTLPQATFSIRLVIAYP